MASYNKTVIHYDGTNVGPIYLKDCGQRVGLGGGKNIYTRGQDRYIDSSSDTTLISTSDVMLSLSAGVIRQLLLNGNIRVELVDEVGGTIAPPPYTVTYSGNGSTGGTVPIDTHNYYAGVNVIVLGNTGSLVKSGKTFTGWNTAANGTGFAYAPGATFPMGAGNVTLYAQWA